MLKGYVSWFTDVSLYFQRIERSFWFGIGIIALAYFTFKQPFDFQLKVFLFVVYSIGLFCLYPIITLYSGKYPMVLKEIDQERFKSIEQSDLPFEEKEMLLKAYLPTPPLLQGIAIIVLFWCLLFELFLVFDLAVFLSQFVWVKQFVNLLSIGIFSDYINDAEQNIFLLQIFRSSMLILSPFKLASMFVIVYSLLANPQIFPITVSAIFANKERSKFGGIVWNLVCMLMLLVGSSAVFFSVSSNVLMQEYSIVLSPYFWYKANGFFIVGSINLICLVKILIDWFEFIFLNKKGV